MTSSTGHHHTKSLPSTTILGADSELGIIEDSKHTQSSRLQTLKSFTNRLSTPFKSNRATLRTLEDKNSKNLARYANVPLFNLLEHHSTSLFGLSQPDAEARLQLNGLNVPSTAKSPQWWQVFLLAIPNPFNILLSVLAITALATGDRPTFTILVIMVAAAVILRFWQEWKSVVAARNLTSLITNNARVYRDGELQQLSSALLVPGDIIKLSGGDMVPADAIILQTTGSNVNQSALTGEMLPVPKRERPMGISLEDDIFDLDNVLFMGTSISSGSTTAVVVATGDNMYMASISAPLDHQPTNSFQRGIRRVSFLLIGFMAVMVPIVFIINGFVTRDWKGAGLFCVSVAVGLTPEMLPMIVNANLAKGAVQMARRSAIVKKLDAIQSLGSMDVLCSDKTGTLTNDSIEMVTAVDRTGQKSQEVFKLAFVNATLQTGLENLLDQAIIEASGAHFQAENVSNHVKVAELSFDFDRKLLSILVTENHTANGYCMITKGAAEEVLDICVLEASERAQLVKLHDDLNNQGYRVIAVATKDVTVTVYPTDSAYTGISAEETNYQAQMTEKNMTFQGFIAFSDSPKEDAAAALQMLRDYNVNVKMLTGDAAPVATRVARSLGILGDHESAITGPQMALMNAEEFKDTVLNHSVFAKLKPVQKLDIVRALQKEGHRVGFLGDGVNDVPALRGADVGISVDSGTSVAKDAADMILLEKDLHIIVEGLLQGRLTFGNTIKYIKLTCSSNFGNVFSILIAAAWLPFAPMSAIQLLIQNLMYDLSQASIPWDNVDETFLQVPREWSAKGILRFMIWTGPTSSIWDICTFSLGYWFYGIKTTDDPLQVATFQTQWFTEGLMTQLLIVVMLRTSKMPFVQSRPATPVAATLTFMACLGLVLPYIKPIASSLHMARPNPSFYGFLVIIVICYVSLVQVVKMAYIKRYKEWL